jgi:glycosyltransferase involved in cell wall biosynthesis
MKVSVVIPVFNNEATVARAIDSVLAQEFDGEFEVVVVNDGSTDATASVLDGYRGRVTVLDRVNGGQAAARNAGMRASHGEYIAFLDADDEWLEGKLEKAVAVLDRDPGCVLVFHDAIEVDGDRQILRPCMISPAQAHAPSLAEMLEVTWQIQPSTVVIRRAVFEAIGGFSEEFRGAGGEDSFAWLLARERGDFAYIGERLSLYKVSGLSQLLAKRIGSLADDGDYGALRAALLRCVEGYGVFARLMRSRYGRRGERLARATVAVQAGTLVAIGLDAIHRGDRRLARRCYLMSLEYARWAPKTWLRLLWTFLPDGLARWALAYLPVRTRRAFAGPPFDALEGSWMSSMDSRTSWNEPASQ